MDLIPKIPDPLNLKFELGNRSPFESVQHLIKLGGTSAAAGVLRRQQPAAAYKMIQKLLLSGKISGPQAISLICQGIPQENWHELGIQSIENH